jgi:hypothetical protein
MHSSCSLHVKGFHGLVKGNADLHPVWVKNLLCYHWVNELLANQVGSLCPVCTETFFEI